MSERRFELLDSYARELDHEADLILPPTSPAEVRRIGRSRRMRRTVIAVVILVVVLLSVGATFVVASAMRGDVPPWATAPSPTQASPALTRTGTTSASATPSDGASVTTTPTPANTAQPAPRAREPHRRRRRTLWVPSSRCPRRSS